MPCPYALPLFALALLLRAPLTGAASNRLALCALDTALSGERLGGPDGPDRIHRLTLDGEGVLWAGSLANGLWRYDGIHLDNLRGAADAENGLRVPYLEGVAQDRRGGFWIATNGDGVAYRPPGGSRFRVFSGQDHRFPHQRALRFHEWNGRLYALADIYGLVELDPDGGAARTYRPPGDSSLPGFHVVIKDAWHEPGNDSLLWLTTQQGLYAFHRPSGGFRAYRPEGPPSFVGRYSFNDLLCRRDTLWMGFWDNGLATFDRASGTFTTILLAPRHPDASVNVVMCLDTLDGHMLLGTGAGLVVLHPVTWRYRLYRMPVPAADPRMSDNWLTAGFPRGAYRVQAMPDGNVYVGTASGWYRWRAADLGLAGPGLRPKAEGLPVRWHRVEAADTSMGPFFLSDSVVLTVDGARSLSLAYGALFPDPERPVRYQTRLDGLDTGWRDQGTRDLVQYTNLSGGTHHIRVRATQDPFGRTWGPEASMRLYVNVPFWRRTDARLGLGIGLLLFLGGGLRTWSRRSARRARRVLEAERTRAERDRRMAELEMQALRARMNPHFLFNSLNSIRLFVMKRDTEAATTYLTRFSQLVRRILEHSGAERIRLSEELEVLRLYAEVEAMRLPDRFTYREHLDPELDPVSVWLPPLLLQPYVENAIWHGLSRKGTPGNLTVAVERGPTSGSVRCRIVDDGIGRAASRSLRSGSPTPNRNRSLGMVLTRERIELTNTLYGAAIDVEIRDLEDGRGHPAGTEVRILLQASRAVVDANPRMP